MHYPTSTCGRNLRLCLCLSVIWLAFGAIASAQSETPTAPDTTWRDAWRSDGDKDPNKSEVAARPWHVWVRAGSTISVPFGDYFDGTTSGIGYEGDVALAVNPRLSLRLIAGRTGVKAEDGFRVLGPDGFGPGYTVEREEVKATAMRYLFCIQFNQIERPRAGGLGNMWYMYNGFGAVVVKPKATVWVRENATGDLQVLTADDSQTRFAMSFGGGYVIVPGSRIGIDLSANMDFVWTKRYTTDGTETVGISGYILDLKAGLVFFL